MKQSFGKSVEAKEKEKQSKIAEAVIKNKKNGEVQ